MYPIIAMEKPCYVPSILLNTYLQANRSGVAVLKSVSIQIRRTAPIQTSCSGKHCDKARPMDWSFNVNQGCGCFGTNSLGTSNIALMHNVFFFNVQGTTVKKEHYSSTKFNKLFMDRPIPPNTSISSLELTEATESLDEAVANCIEMINDAGFEIVLWYSRGEINNRSLVGLNTQDDEVK